MPEIYAAEGDGIIEWLTNLTGELTGLIPTLLQLGGLGLVLVVIFTTRSAVKSITTALLVIVMLTLTGNMPGLSNLIGNELSAPAGTVVPAEVSTGIVGVDR